MDSQELCGMAWAAVSGGRSLGCGKRRCKGHAKAKHALHLAIYSVELLERRVMLSSGVISSPSALALTFQPTYQIYDNSAGSSADAAGISPEDASSPAGLTPSQMTTAYQMNQVTFGSTIGDGTGQTIAIIEAYDDPNAAG